MDPFTSSFVAGLMTNLVAGFIKGSSRRLSKSIFGTEKERAIKRCLKSALGTVTK